MRRYLLDSSFVIDLLNEIADNDVEGVALKWLRMNRPARLWISPVTLAEVLEGAEDVEAVKAYLSRYGWQGIHRSQAERAALRQRRAADRMGENDAWQAAVAECMKARVLGHDDAFKRLGAGYEDFRRA
ncbi:MAG TPA: PIN domain-containing protein [Steroidobacteraceae bacterium]|nr:PIN domain-containing protein [Steroidobacteraceae bacterium]